MSRTAATAFFVLAALAHAACSNRAPVGAPAAGPGREVLTRVWTVELEAKGEIQLEAAPGGFVVAATDGTILYIRGEDGSERWRKDLGGRIAGPVIVVGTPSPAVSERERSWPASRAWVAAPLEGGSVALAEIGVSGEPSIWSTGWPAAVLTAVGADVFASTNQGDAALYSPAEGKRLWQRRLLPSVGVSAALCGGRLLVGCPDGRILGVEAASGRILWSKGLGAPLAVRPACDEKHALAATTDNVLHALRLHRRSAGVMWRTRSGADPAAPPLLVDRQALLISKDTFLYGFRGRNGHLAFRVRLNRRPGPAGLLGDLLMVAGPHAARLDAFRLPAGRSAGGLDLPEGTRFVTPPVVSEGKVAIALARYGEERSRLLALTRSSAGDETSSP